MAALTVSKTPPPRKPPRPKRKRGEPLAELSINVPLAYKPRSDKHPFLHSGKPNKRQPASRDRVPKLDLKPTLRSFMSGHDIFRDEGATSSTPSEQRLYVLVNRTLTSLIGLYDGRPFSAPSSIPPKYVMGYHSMIPTHIYS